MNSRGTLILVAVFAALAAYVYFFEINKTQEQISRTLGTPTLVTQPYVLQIKTADVKTLQVRDLRAAKEVTVSRTEQGWWITPPNKEADAPKIDQAIGYIGSLQATRVLNNVGDIKTFGFGTATLEIRLLMNDGTPYAITVGDKTPDESNYYVIYTGATDKVFIVGTLIIDGAKVLLDAPPLITPTATPFAPVEATPAPAGTATPKP